VPFRFNGKIEKLTFHLGPEQLTSDERQTIRHTRARARD
jgi:arylsulfatase